MRLAGVDIVVLGLYFCSIVFIGYWTSRREKDTEDFFLGGRRMPWGAVCLSILATEMSVLTFVGVPADSFRANYAYLQFAIGSLIGRVLIALLFLPAFYKGRVTTVYQYLFQRFGEGTRGTATIFFFVTRLLASGVRLLAASITVSVVTGWPLVISIILMAFIAMVYTTVGGIKAVIWTDVMQFIVLMGGALLAIGLLLYRVPGGWHSVTALAGPVGKLRVFDLYAAISNPKWLLVGIVNGCFMTFAALGTDQDLTQRMLTCKRTGDSQKALILTGVLDFPIVMAFLFIGTLLWAFYQHFPDANLPANTDRIFPYFIVTQLPMGIRGLLIAGALAAAMSSLDSALGALSSSAVVDIYRPHFKRHASERHYLAVSRLFVVIFCLALIGIAIACRGIEQILWLAFKIGGFTYGSLLGVFLLGVIAKRGSNRGNIIAMISSLVVVTILFRL
ncbi:MAG TPA: sodium:solute symporter, partial [bacterium (Candidatus Stahlbacteria)]|nr:sodium:solute symporter [Candidatus Stahlbacteria bacterium]